LRWKSNQPEGAAGAELGVSDQQLAVDAADHQRFFAPIKLKRFA
jgi:hypothetical protein